MIDQAERARLAEEVGELAREVNHQFGPKPKKPDEAPGSIAMELADILFVVVCIANSQQIDLDQAFGEMMAKVTTRDEKRWTRKRSAQHSKSNHDGQNQSCRYEW